MGFFGLHNQQRSCLSNIYIQLSFQETRLVKLVGQSQFTNVPRFFLFADPRAPLLLSTSLTYSKLFVERLTLFLYQIGSQELVWLMKQIELQSFPENSQLQTELTEFHRSRISRFAEFSEKT